MERGVGCPHHQHLMPTEEPSEAGKGSCGAPALGSGADSPSEMSSRPTTDQGA